MKPRRSKLPQEVPHDFAALLIRLRDDEDPLLNAVLALARDRGWRALSLATALEMNAPAVSKRIERARRASARADVAWGQVIQRLSDVCVPEAPESRTGMIGNQLSESKQQELLSMQEAAEKVNGAMPADHPSRQISEMFAAELNRLITDEDFTSSYLAQALGRTPRAITSRLERHGFRPPCPSVAGTPSGEYHARKIGDPGEGVRRISPRLRDELRAGWDAAADLEDPVQLKTAVRTAVQQGFTMASIAQALHVGMGELNWRLEGSAVRVDA